MQIYNAWCDGSSDGSNSIRPGGAAYIIFDTEGREIKRASKGFINTTSNRMEILAIMSIVNSLPDDSIVMIYSDSQYSINVLSGKWKASMNLDQIERYLKIKREKNIKVEFVWVKGHTGNTYNELCDQLAKRECLSILYKHKYGLQKVFTPTTPQPSKPSKKKKTKPSWTNELEEQYYSQITTKGRKKKTKKK